MNKHIVTEIYSGQRIDNYLMRQFRRLPKSRIYKAIRSGEVRVNGRRVKAEYRVQVGDELRLPPFRINENTEKSPFTVKQSRLKQLAQRIMVEDKSILLLNKPSGIPVHGGSGIQGGIVEMLRILKAPIACLELVHRLDRETSGCLLLAKKRSVLVALNEQLAQQQIRKRYIALVKGQCRQHSWQVDAPLHRYVLASGERRVRVSDVGKPAITRFRCLQQFKQAALVEATPLTGRTHQIRVHACHSGYPLAGDDKYGDEHFNQVMTKLGLKRLFLHAASLRFRLPDCEQSLYVGARMDESLLLMLQNIGVSPKLDF